MTRHVVIGTAGHVDHGKTALVKALTGVDTDRWEEEKRRGITIDLGFAPLALGPDLSASIVDVPGHEDFIRNMVAGATGIDLALLVVAADEGIMPQTTEHLAILEFLGVRAGVIALTKADLVEPEWIELVDADVRDRVRASSIAWADPVVVSATDGRGLEILLEVLRAAAGQAAQRSADDLFRMPVDRSFSVAGAGTVVTGTVWSGSVGAGDDVRVLPGDRRARVRSIEVHGVACDRAVPGRRSALALPGVERHAVERGTVVVTGDAWQATTSLDVLVTLLPTARRVTQRSRVRLHLGTAEVMARVTPGGGEIEPGSTGEARLRLEAPVVARWGDRGVLRSYSPVTTIGGCFVVDPWPPSRPRRPVILSARAVPDPIGRLGSLVRLTGTHGVPLDSVTVRLGIHPREVAAIVEAARRDGVVSVGPLLLSESVIADARRRIQDEVTGYHHAKPLEPGMPLELLRRVVASSALADAALDGLVGEGQLVVEGGLARKRDFSAALTGDRSEIGETIRRELETAGAHGRTAEELSQRTAAAREVAEFLVRQGTAVRIGSDRYYERRALEALRDEIVSEVKRRGRATPAELRDRTGLTRKFLIPVLEWLDGAGFTVREGDARRPGPAARSVTEGA